MKKIEKVLEILFYLIAIVFAFVLLISISGLGVLCIIELIQTI